MIPVILLTIATMGQIQPYYHGDAWIRVQQLDELGRGTPRILPGTLPYPYSIPNYYPMPYEHYRPYQPFYYQPYYYQPYRPYYYQPYYRYQRDYQFRLL
jgi:hypothetical protein